MGKGLTGAMLYEPWERYVTVWHERLHQRPKNEMLARTERHRHMRRKGSYPQDRARLNASQKCEVSGQKWLRVVAGYGQRLIFTAPKPPLERQKAPAWGKGFSCKILFLL
jgi:hypothetical protein